MAYTSKVNRLEDARDARQAAWARSLAAKSTGELVADLEAVVARLGATPARHQRVITRLCANIRTLQAALTERRAQEAHVYCVDCGAETELDCICDDLNFADGACDCGAHNEI